MRPGTEPPAPLTVRTEDRQLTMTAPFCIGRSEDCEFHIPNEYVSRRHVEVTCSSGQWRLRDLGSANGIFVGEQRITSAEIDKELTVRLGIAGPFVSFSVVRPVPVELPETDDAKVAQYAERYFRGASPNQPAGEHTMLVRKAFSAVQRKQRRKYAVVVGVMALCVVVAAGVALFQYRRSSRQAALAEELFYAMKSLDVDVARVEKQLADAGSPQADTYTAQHRQRREAMEARYNEFLSALGVYDNKLSEQDRLILRVARIFGECELAMPEDFKRQVEGYIDKWKSSGRFARAVARAGANGYTTPIVRELLKHNLPPQFFYLALQESDFDEYVSGPMTYKGIAKGMWQFIPETALKYGLRLGPLVDAPRPDPADERHQWQKATAAAARYLKDIYATDAQASGLLVMASYNWGEDKVVRLLRSMPANPRERNFWKVLTEHRARVPDQTYDYVFYIVAAAVIGENPRLFGFPFDNPLSRAELR